MTDASGSAAYLAKYYSSNYQYAGSAVIMNTLPSFLELISANVPGSKDSLSCAYMHPDNLAQNKNHCLWWPCKAQDKAPSVFVLFIPGRSVSRLTQSSSRSVSRQPWSCGVLHTFS